MTGNGNQDSCALNFPENGIDTNSRNNVSIFGPGLVRRFNANGIVVGGNHSSVEGVAITSICAQAIVVSGSYNEIEGNSISRDSLDVSEAIRFFAGIFVSAPGGHNSILNNEVVGAGVYPIMAGQGGFGIFVGEPGARSNNNLFQENDASGNPGSGIFITLGSTGNTVRHNQALGGVDLANIFDQNALPANTYDNNLCEVSQIGPSQQNICQLPNIAGHRNGPVDRN